MLSCRWLSFDSITLLLIPWDHATGKEHSREFCQSPALLPSPFSDRPDAGTCLSFECSTSSCCLEQSVREDTVWIFSNAGPEENTGVSFFLTSPWHLSGSPLPYIFSICWLLLALLCSSPFSSRAFSHQTAARGLKWGCCRQRLGCRLHDFLNLTAQLHAIAGTAEELRPTRCCPWLCKYELLLWPAKRGDAAGGPQLLQNSPILYLQERVYGWRRTRNKGQRHGLCVIFACLWIVRLVAQYFLVSTANWISPVALYWAWIFELFLLKTSFDTQTCHVLK